MLTMLICLPNFESWIIVTEQSTNASKPFSSFTKFAIDKLFKNLGGGGGGSYSHDLEALNLHLHRY